MNQEMYLKNSENFDKQLIKKIVDTRMLTRRMLKEKKLQEKSMRSQ